MKMAYLILAHEQEAQLNALIAALLPPGSPDLAIIHADRRSALWPRLRDRPADPAGRVHILPDPVTVRWGHHSMVTAMERLIAAALKEECDFAHLLSGADWPILPRNQIAAALSARSLLPCMIEAGFEDRFDERMQTYRLDARWLRLDPEKDRLAYAATWELRRISGWLDRVRPALGLARSRPWGPWQKGSQWWSLPREALELLGVELPRLRRSGRLAGTVCADEHVIQTIVAAHFPGRLAPDRRFVDWSEGRSSPRILTRSDLSDLTGSGAWFARKLDVRVDDFFLRPDAFARASKDASVLK